MESSSLGVAPMEDKGGMGGDESSSSSSSSSSPSPPPANLPPLPPMIPVPRALEIVLAETSRILWHHHGGQRIDEDRVYYGNERSLIGRVSAMDVIAPYPGYPNHNSAIMDGYAVRTIDLTRARETHDDDDYDETTNDRDGSKFILDFAVVERVYAGDGDRRRRRRGRDDDNDDDDARDAGMSRIESERRMAAYVTTGAVVPDDYDAVIPIEDTQWSSSSSSSSSSLARNDDNITPSTMRVIPSRVESVLRCTTPGTWIRPIGCDIPPGTVVLSRGETIRPVHVALLAQVGICPDEVRLSRLPRVGVISTGNELYSPHYTTSSYDDDGDVRRSRGMIPDVNRTLLLSQLSTYGNCVPIDLGIVKDDDGIERIANRLNGHLWPEEGGGIDVLISTGGISMGVRDVMERIYVEGMGGNVHFGRLDMKPGKPTTFITIDRDMSTWQSRKLVFALPGNPVSASVCTELLVRPCLDLLHRGIEFSSGSSQEAFVDDGVRNAIVHEEVMATIASDIVLDQGRPEYRRVTLKRNAVSEGGDRQRYTYTASDTGVQRSSRVLSLRGACGLMVLPRGGSSGCGYDVARKGMEFPVLLYSSLSGMTSETRFVDSMHRNLWTSSEERHLGSGKKLALGVIAVCSFDADADDFVSIVRTLVTSLGGESKVSVVQRVVCRVDDVHFAQQLPATINGPPMEGANVIFVVVPTDPRQEDSGAIAFRSGLEVAHTLSPMLSKNAHAMALRVRKSAAARDPLAALFECVVGTVRENSCVLISCSDRGLEGAAGAVGGILVHLLSTL